VKTLVLTEEELRQLARALLARDPRLIPPAVIASLASGDEST